MTNHESNSIDRQSELFIELISMDEPQRRESLDSIEPGLRRDLEELLEAHQNPNEILLDQTDLCVATKTDSNLLREGDRIGDYKILQLIGQGGMGQVYMAEQQTRISRRVALKLIQADRISKNVIARFEAEREALSRLDHPGIARILDAGMTANGQHYFTMELIKGVSIVEFCDREKLGLKQRISLLENVCRAIHHAHQKGIIHRDLKPSNILVAIKDGQPTVKIIDFGIAKGLDEPLSEQTMFTRFGELIGTPNYMSPEQVENGGIDLDIRADIYSLGVLLHELVTGQLPYEFQPNRGLLKQLEELRDREAVRPSLMLTQSAGTNSDTIEELASRRQITYVGWLKYLQGDLDWIILKSLSKTRSERYESAAAFGNDLVRFLNHEPVEAVAPTWAYKARKLFQKHRTASIFVVLSLLALVGLTLFSTVSSITAHRVTDKLQRQTTQLQLEIEKSRRLESRAMTAEKRANQLARKHQNEAVTARAASAYFLDAIKNPDSGTAPFLVMAEWQQTSPVQVSRQTTVIGADASAVDIDSHELPEGLAEKIKEKLSSSEFGNSGIELSQGIQMKMKSAQGRAIRTGDFADLSIRSSVSTDQLNRERIGMLEFVKAEQIREFGEKDDFVGESLLKTAKLYAELGESTKAQLAAHQALEAFSSQDGIDQCREYLEELAQ